MVTRVCWNVPVLWSPPLAVRELASQWRTIHYFTCPSEGLKWLKFPPLISVPFACADNLAHMNILLRQPKVWSMMYIRLWFSHLSVLYGNIRWVKILVISPGVCPMATKGELKLMEVAARWPTFVVLPSYCYWRLKNCIQSEAVSL